MPPFRELSPTSVFLHSILHFPIVDILFLAARWVDPALGFAVRFLSPRLYIYFDNIHFRLVG